MSADFSHYTNYKDDTSFSKVVFGSSAPVLEVEMNELQEIVDTKLKALHSIVGKCAFVQGAITRTRVSDSIYNVTVTNCTLIDKGFTAYVDSITSSDTTISSSANVYFSLTKARVTGADPLNKYGVITGTPTTITNEICDSRVGAETTQREQIQVSLHITTGTVPNDTDVTVYLPIGTIFNGVFTKNETVFSDTMVDLISTIGFKNKSSIRITYIIAPNSRYLYLIIVDEATIGSNPNTLNFTWSYKTVNGSTIVEDWTDVTPTTESGTKHFLANDTSSPTITKIYVKSKVIDNITYEVQTKEFEISVPSQYQN